MGRSTSFRDLMNAIKDKASQSKAAIKISTSKSHSSLHLSLLRATTHDHSAPPDPKHVAALLSFGHGSRATASAAIESLMDRLQTTRDSSVAVKCLVVVHSIIKHGSFILQDQLSIYPASGGRNYLKLSDFRDGSNPASWELSIWVRWYARYLEQLLYASRVLGFFLCSASSAPEKEKAEERVSAMVNSDLVKETDSLVGLIEEIGKLPESLQLEGNRLIGEIRDLVSDDFLSAVNDVSVRVEEFKHRVGRLSFGESVELVCVLKRLERCRERLGESWTRKRVLIEGLWSAAREVLDAAAAAAAEEEEEKCGGGGRLLLTWRRKEQGSESDRFGSRVLSFSDSFKGSSVRFGSNRYT
ncbi:Putative clathrin assembly protein At4g40080 [Linum perenne]